MKQELYIYDRETFFKSIHKIKENSTLACLGVETQEIETSLRNANYQQVDVLDLSQYVEDASQQVRDYLVENLTKLPSFTSSNNILDQNYGVDLWYFLTLSEKSSFRSNLHQRLFFLSQIEQLLGAHKFTRINYLLKDDFLNSLLCQQRLNRAIFLSRELCYFVNAARYIFKTLFIKFIRKLHRYKELDSNSPRILVFSLFPYWWLNPYTSKVRDRFFPGIPTQDDSTEFSHISWLTTSLIEYARNRKHIRNVESSLNIRILQDFIRLRDVINLFNLYRFRLLIQFRNRARVSKLPKFNGFDIRDSMAYEISRSIGNSDLQLSLLVYISLRRYLASNHSSKILFRFERQPIDSAVIFASKGFVRSVGYWHSSMSLCSNYTSLHFPKEYLKRYCSEDYPEIAFPNQMLVPNLFCWNSLEMAGYDMSVAKICGPTRHITEISKARILNSSRRMKNRNRITIAFSSDPNSANLLFQIMVKIHKINSEVVFLIKTHPAYQMSPSYFFQLQKLIGKDSYILIDENRDYLDSINDCAAIILSGTQLAFEATLVNVFPIVYEPTNSYNATNFDAFQEYCFIARNSDEIIDFLREIMVDGVQAKKKKDKWSRLREMQFGESDHFSWGDFRLLLHTSN